VQGSNWDSDSIMEYPFPAGLILQPERYRTQPLRPGGGLSPRDLSWVRAFYPAEEEHELPELLPFQSRELAILAGQQRDFVLRPTATRQYTLQGPPLLQPGLGRDGCHDVVRRLHARW